jgi:hypothetical protein
MSLQRWLVAYYYRAPLRFGYRELGADEHFWCLPTDGCETQSQSLSWTWRGPTVIRCYSRHCVLCIPPIGCGLIHSSRSYSRSKWTHDFLPPFWDGRKMTLFAPTILEHVGTARQAWYYYARYYTPCPPRWCGSISLIHCIAGKPEVNKMSNYFWPPQY